MTSYSWFTLLSCFLFHIQIAFGSWWIGNACYGQLLVFWSMFHGILYLIYPLSGWVAEVCLGIYRTLKLSFWLYLISTIALLIVSSARIIHPEGGRNVPLYESVFTYLYVIVVILSLLGLAMYEANAIQFGMDQMLDASSEQLSSFIHWYFWCAHIGPIIIFYTMVGVYWYFTSCIANRSNILSQALSMVGWVSFSSSLIQLPVFALGTVLVTCYVKYFHIEETPRKPLKIVYNVLKYSFKHRYPERRSAFTYWENDIPSRIDLGKEKYGGPFTYEQVEDVKAMFRLLLLMISLFGFHLIGDGYSITTFIMNTVGCVSFVPSVVFIANPQHIQCLVVIFGVPVIRLLQKYYRSCKFSSLLSRISSGLFICLLIEALHCTYSILLVQYRYKFGCSETAYFHQTRIPVLLKCLVANFRVVGNDSSCEYFCSSHPVNSYVIDLGVVIVFLQGLAYLLVFMTMLEFICAQSPNAMKGLLIGIWYSMLSIKGFMINVLDAQVVVDFIPWNIYHGIKGFGIFVSIVFFWRIRKSYRYRERNEVVNEQAIIEEQYERELLINAKTKDK